MFTKEELLSKETFVTGFKSVEDIYQEFEVGLTRRYSSEEQDWVFDVSDVEKYNRTKDYQIIYANYDGGGYDGSAHVIGYDHREEKFFEVYGSHCSCYGLEDQWSPEYFDSVEQFISALERRPNYVARDTKEYLGLKSED